MATAEGVESVRLVHDDALGNRWWWEIRRHDATVVLRHGQDGRSGELRSRTYGTRAAALLEADRTIASRLALGYRRESSILPIPAAERAVDEDPADPTAWSVYADWLLETGDPRGERLSRSLAGDEQAMAELARPYSRSSGLDVWFGFIVAARLDERAPGGELLSVLGNLRRLIHDPAARFLGRLELDAITPISDLAAVILAGGPRWPLRDLRLVERSEGPPHDLGLTLSLFPRLQRLALDGPAAVLGRIAAPHLLYLAKRRLSAADLAGLAGSDLPALRHLRLERGLSSSDQLERATDGRRLESLGLRRARIRGVGAVLAGLPLAPGLVELDLRQCGLTDADVATLLAGPFDALCRLDIRGNDVRPALLAVLAERFTLQTEQDILDVHSG